MYMNEVFNNFLGTLRPSPDLRINNVNLEHGKFINDRSKHYAGKSIMISTDDSIDGSGKNTEIKAHVPSPCLIERSSGPEVESIIEGFNVGSRVVEGNTNGGSGTAGMSADQRATLQTAISLYQSRYTAYSTALNEYNAFKQNVTYSQYLNNFVKVVTSPTVPASTGVAARPEEANTYYINNYGFRFTVPLDSATRLPVVPAGVVAHPGANTTTNLKTISVANLAAFPPQPGVASDAYRIRTGQDLTLAGKFVRFLKPSSTATTKVYAWVDVEGVAHAFSPSILSDVNNNASSTCQQKLRNSNIETYADDAAFNAKVGGLVGGEITDAAYLCTDLPTDIINKKKALDQQEQTIAATLRAIYAELPEWASSSSASSSSSSSSSSASSQPPLFIMDSNGNPVLNPALTPDELVENERLKKNMSTYQGKVTDTFKNVKSKLAYYVMWLALMIFIVVVTFRNMANSDGPDSGSFQVSAAILIVLVIYLFNFLSDMRIGPNQALSKFFGALPEKVSGMMKFTFT